MLYIKGNQFNTVYTSVSPHKTISNPTYLMCLEHAQSGKKYSFIPQNVTSFSGSPYNNRYDLFRFNVSESGVNLTGGTRYWTKRKPPALVYSDCNRYNPAALLGTDKIYINQTRVLPGIVGFIQIFLDTKDNGEIFTGGTFFADGVDLSVPMSFNLEGSGCFTERIPYAQIPLATTNQGYTATTFTYTLETNSGRTFSDTLYLASIKEINDIEPWKYYGDEYQDNFRIPEYPITYLGETTVNIDEVGQFYYSIRQQSSKTNIDCSLSGDKLEEGLLYLTQDFTDTYYYTGGTVNVYDPTETPTYHILQEDEFHILTEDNNLLTQE